MVLVIRNVLMTLYDKLLGRISVEINIIYIHVKERGP